jgi:multidrug efflux pump subunit AcrB
VAEVNLTSEIATLPRFNGRRMNEVQAFLEVGVLPAEVLGELKQRLAASGFSLPPGYSMEYGGEAAKRDDAVGNLMANVGVLAVLMVATLVLSLGSFRLAGVIGVVGALATGVGFGALWVWGFPFGFMAIIGSMGLAGVAINDAIVVLAAVRNDSAAREGDPGAMAAVVLENTRHVLATTFTTIAGFTPLILSGGGFWPPLAVTIAGGVSGATVLALYFGPAAYRALMCRRCAETSPAADEAKRTEASPLQPAAAGAV